MISILLLTYNQKKTNEQFILHLYENTTHAFKLFILDNGSETENVDYLSTLRHDNIKIFFNNENKGIIEGRNQLYTIYKGEITDKILFIDNDQFVQKGWDIDYINNMNHFDIVGSEAWAMNRSFIPVRRVLDANSRFHYIGAGGMMLKKDVFGDIGGFDTRFAPKYFEDPDFCFRALEKGYKIGFCPNAIYHAKKNLTLNGDDKKYFFKSLNYFQQKWKHRSPE